MDATDLNDARRWLAKRRSASGRLRKESLAEVLTLIERARGTGITYRAVAEALGISVHTMMGWRQRSKQATSLSRLAPVQVTGVQREATEPPRASLRVRGPRGLEVEGMTVVELAELWKRLS